VTINGARMASDSPVPAPLHGRYLVVRVGRKRLSIGRAG
jgi:hypothetical protein